MSISALMHWFTSDQGLMALVSQNWLLGLAIIALVIFCETGLVILPFLPGDSLLFTAGAFLGAADVLPLWPVVVIVVAAILGDFTNYSIGRSSVGRQLITRGWVNEHHLVLTRDYFDRYGGFAITMARFVPIVRTIAPFLAGLSAMDRRRFAVFNALGGVLWGGGMLLAGFWSGSIPWVRAHLSQMTLAIVVLSLLPVAHQLWSARKTRSNAQLPG